MVSRKRACGTVCGRPATAAAGSGQGLELSERFGAAWQVWFGAREVGSAPSPALGKHSTTPVDVLADRQEKQTPNLSDLPLNWSQVAESRRRSGWKAGTQSKVPFWNLCLIGAVKSGVVAFVSVQTNKVEDERSQLIHLEQIQSQAFQSNQRRFRGNYKRLQAVNDSCREGRLARRLRHTADKLKPHCKKWTGEFLYGGKYALSFTSSLRRAKQLQNGIIGRETGLFWTG